MAVEAGQFVIVQALLQSALAAHKGDIDLINKLLERGADVNNGPAAYGGITALQFAVLSGLLGVTRKLLGVGAKVNVRRAQKYGRTASEDAAEHGRIDMKRSLKKDRKQFIRAIKLAERNGHLAASLLLKTFGIGPSQLSRHMRVSLMTIVRLRRRMKGRNMTMI
ncbi:hypothetical protein BO94DRAFT_130095 [Aspergillus sclerotioniger CBS 115572]|uniref:Uncharacterized protein n=1 Tax=Aspergillus sclerotioniger CBS 115572 TaxID=1450535 RepID=A0A317XAZ9_9EURO|nr:hypothetical protein BO94DRAFT_130095 [Aspergillus sclerotioniger CBS 115572]PWY95565.1 hypothetical protein BO94DRAFT_130095 [Aspergillus sclerotioniger CBS 115572]